MTIPFRYLETLPFPKEFQPSVLTIGNFDGCHLGHQRLIATTIELAKKMSAHPGALTFAPHPDVYFQKLNNWRGLFSPEQKTQALRELGLDFHFCQEFNEQWRQTSPELFIGHFLQEAFDAVGVVVGDNFRFGKGRTGTTELLQERLEAAEGEVRIIDHVIMADEPVSSTRIRDGLSQRGDVRLAAKLLGRPFALQGTVVEGQKLGRTIGFPTINLGNIGQLLPHHGVYAGFVHLQRPGEPPAPLTTLATNTYGAAINIGQRPTVGGIEVRVEAHLLAEGIGADALYEQKATVYFIDRLRNEQRFANVEELKEQIGLDVAQARNRLTQWQ